MIDIKAWMIYEYKSSTEESTYDGIFHGVIRVTEDGRYPRGDAIMVFENTDKWRTCNLGLVPSSFIRELDKNDYPEYYL